MAQDEMVTEYLEKGRIAYAENRYSEAAAALQSAYELTQTVVINHLLVQALVADEQFKAAQGIADEAVASYYEDDHDAQLYLTILIKNQQFVPAHEFIYAVPQEQQTELLADLTEHEQMFTQQQMTTLKTIARQFYHLSDVSPYEQQERLQMANQLPLAEYLKGAKFLLVDPFLSAVGRATIVDQLRRLHVKESVQINWFEESLTVVPADLVPLEEMTIYQRIQINLKKHEQLLGPDLVTVLAEQAHLMLMMAYPNLTAVITDEASWVAGIIAETLGEVQPNEPIDQQNWRTKLSQEMLRFLQ